MYKPVLSKHGFPNGYVLVSSGWGCYYSLWITTRETDIKNRNSALRHMLRPRASLGYWITAGSTWFIDGGAVLPAVRESLLGILAEVL